jgi:Phosphopantetheine attachment site
VLSVWTEVLGKKKIGIDDNFFDMGGHSLTAAQVTARLYDRCRVRLPLRSIFEAPTAAGLARLIDTMPPDAGHLHNIASAGEDAVTEEGRI